MKQDTGIHQMVQKVNKISNLKTLYFDLKTLKSRVHDEKNNDSRPHWAVIDK
jgi:hypothetical protein